MENIRHTKKVACCAHCSKPIKQMDIWHFICPNCKKPLFGQCYITTAVRGNALSKCPKCNGDITTALEEAQTDIQRERAARGLPKEIANTLEEALANRFKQDLV